MRSSPPVFAVIILLSAGLWPGLSAARANTDNTPPFISNLFPPPGAANVPPATMIFCEIRDEGSGVDSASIRMWVNGAEVRPRIFPIYHGGQGYSVFYEPPSPFGNGQAVAVSYAASDLAGNLLTYQYAFMTAGGGDDDQPPMVAFTQPANGAANVSPRTDILAGIMDQAPGFMTSSIDPSTVIMRLNGAEVTAVKMSYYGGLLVRYTPPVPLAEGARYDVELEACDVVGNCMPTFTFGFQVMAGGSAADAHPPVIHGFDPPPGADNVPVDAPVSFMVEDLPMNGEPSGIQPDSIVVAVNDVITERQLLPEGWGFRVRVEHPPFPPAAGIRLTVWACDHAGNCSEQNASFTTMGTSGDDLLPPVATAVFPANGAAGVPLTSDVYAELYDDGAGRPSGIDPSTARLTIAGRQVPFTTQPLPGNGLMVHWANDAAFPPATLLSARVRACDYAGNCMEPFVWTFLTAAADDDTEPPVLAEPVPAYGAQDVPVSSSISFALRDNGSGIDLASITLAVDGIPAASLAIEGEGAEVLVSYDPPGDLRADADVIVAVGAADNANNAATFVWSFRTAASGSAAPVPVYPANDAWLNRLLEQGMIRFSWTAWGISAAYRVEVSISDLPVFTIDYGPDDFAFAFGVTTVSYPVAALSWDVLAGLGPLAWRVAEIDAPGGSVISPYSEVFTFTLAPTDCITLRTPADFSVIGPGEPPVFSWDPDTAAGSYLFGIAHAADDGIYFDEIYSAVLPMFFSEIPVTDEVWQQLTPGTWIWTVLALDSAGQYGNFMMFHFEKSAE